MHIQTHHSNDKQCLCRIHSFLPLDFKSSPLSERFCEVKSVFWGTRVYCEWNFPHCCCSPKWPTTQTTHFACNQWPCSASILNISCVFICAPRIRNSRHHLQPNLPYYIYFGPRIDQIHQPNFTIILFIDEIIDFPEHSPFTFRQRIGFMLFRCCAVLGIWISSKLRII